MSGPARHVIEGAWDSLKSFYSEYATPDALARRHDMTLDDDQPERKTWIVDIPVNPPMLLKAVIGKTVSTVRIRFVAWSERQNYFVRVLFGNHSGEQFVHFTRFRMVYTLNGTDNIRTLGTVDQVIKQAENIILSSDTVEKAMARLRVRGIQTTNGVTSRIRETSMNAKLIVDRLLEDDIPGGSDIGERHDTSSVDSDELAMGLRVEREHTDDPRVAEEIALDHLAEDPKYYSKGRTCGMFPELD